MKIYKKPLIVFGLFLVCQAVMSIVVMVAALLLTPEALELMVKGDVAGAQRVIMGPGMMGTSLILSSVLSIFIAKWMGTMKFKKAFSCREFNMNNTIIAFVIMAFGVFGTNLLSELLNLPNIIEAQLNGMASNVWGILAIAFFGPVAEEVIFRETCLGYPLRKGVKPFKAILISSLLFGVMHLNPAQIPFAFIVGLLLGIIYWRTGNIVLTSILHIINNGLSCLQLAVMGEEEASSFKLTEQIGGPLVSAIVIIVCAAICFYFIKIFKDKTEEIDYQDNE